MERMRKNQREEDKENNQGKSYGDDVRKKRQDEKTDQEESGK